MNSRLKALCRDRSGATAIEYGLIAAVLAVTILLGFSLLGPELSVLMQEVADQLNPG